MSTVTAVREALFALLIDDDALTDALGGVSIYDEAAPTGAAFPYIVIGGTEEGEGGGAFGQAGNDGLENIRIHTRAGTDERPGAAQAKALYGHLSRVLHGRDIDLGEAVLWNAKVRLVTTFVERDGVTTSAPARYTYNTMRK